MYEWRLPNNFFFLLIGQEASPEFGHLIRALPLSAVRQVGKPLWVSVFSSIK